MALAGEAVLSFEGFQPLAPAHPSVMRPVAIEYFAAFLHIFDGAYYQAIPLEAEPEIIKFQSDQLIFSKSSSWNINLLMTVGLQL